MLTMVSEASHKVPEGKLVKIKVETEDEEVYEVEIRGDFFLEPPEKLSELEEKLEEADIDSSKSEIAEKLNEIDAELIGFSTSDVAEAFQKAIKEGDE